LIYILEEVIIDLSKDRRLEMNQKSKKISYPVNERLEYWFKNTTYADRLQWLEDIHEFLSWIEKGRARPIRFKSH
jgi:hypothetical protein